MIAKPLLTASLFALAATAFAQEQYPSRPITMIMPWPPGGFVDLTGRPIAAAMEKILGQPVVVTTRSGAGGAVGLAAAANSKPDGYNFVTAAISISLIPAVDQLFDRKPAYTLNQFAPIADP